ncbi:RipA family octameric membrane protein [Streptomyces ardesiacus]|uniref:RipA family octameric membrane protein n=1 Tax=Streptomyces ardesiacus TaxID=285564 RepID=UPI003F4A5107
MRRQAPRPSITWFTDCATNAITGVAVTPGHPSRKSVLAALRSADLRDGPHRRCAARFVMVRSNWQLNAAKFEVTGAFEQRLPPYAYPRAEGAALGEGRELPLTHVEQWVPLIFTFAHVVAFCALVV